VRADVRQTLKDLERQRLREASARAPRDPDQRMLAVGPDTALFLNTLARARRARLAIEVGGSMGYSTIWLGEALKATGGRLVSLEIVPAKIEILRRRIKQAGLTATIEVKPGDALELLRGLRGPFDLVLIDAWKDDYPLYFDLVFPRLAVGGLIVADNITHPPPGPEIDAYVEKARSHPNARSQLIPIGSGLELTVKLR